MRESFEPHRAAWHVLAILIGVSAFVVPPRGIAAIVPSWVLALWAVALLASGTAGLIGPLWQAHNLSIALAIERSALWVQSGTLLWIIASALYVQGMTNGLGLVAYVVWIIANAVRDRRIASAITKPKSPPGV